MVFPPSSVYCRKASLREWFGLRSSVEGDHDPGKTMDVDERR